MDKFQLLRYYGEYLDSDDFDIIEHEFYLGESILDSEELCFLYRNYCMDKDINLSKGAIKLKNWLLNTVFVPHRVPVNLKYEVENGILF